MSRKRIFGAAVFVCLFIFAIIFTPLLYGTRALTDAEITLLEPIYQSSVKLEKVRIKSGGLLTLTVPGITIGNTISFPKNSYDVTHRRDKAMLIHEVCHVWQYQNFGLGYIPGSMWENTTQRDAYVINYDASKTFRDYDIEEQCEIVADYFLTGDMRYEPYIAEIKSQ